MTADVHQAASFAWTVCPLCNERIMVRVTTLGHTLALERELGKLLAEHFATCTPEGNER